MTALLARKCASCLRLANLVLAFALVLLLARQIIGWNRPSEATYPDAMNWSKTETAPPKTVKIEDFRALTQARILPDRPQTHEVKTVKKIATTPALPKKLPDLPFAWAGAIVHSDPQQSRAILLDRRDNRQIMVKRGEKLPQTDMLVIAISESEFTVDCAGTHAWIKRPVTWTDLGRNMAETADREREVPQAMPHDSGESDVQMAGGKQAQSEDKGDDLEKCGLESNDRIIAVEGQRIRNAQQAHQSLSRLDKSVARVAVLRQGRIISLVVSTRSACRMLEQNQ